MKLDLGTFLVQCAAGGMLFCWVTTRRREVSLGYGWLLRIVYGLLAIGGAVALLANDHTVAGAGAILCAAMCAIGLAVSVVRRKAGVGVGAAMMAERKARVAAMVGREDAPVDEPPTGPEFPPVLDLAAGVVGMLTMLACATFAGGPYALAAARLLVGAAFLGSVTDAMLLGHWYLVQPGLRRDPIKELVVWTGAVWPFEILVFLWPVGMVSVLNGTIDDGYNGLLGWVWVTCAVTTIGLVVMTWFALKERAYSAVMAATGLLYLAILTAFGVDLIARAVLTP
ncbi:MAG TPA: hypothetical protein VFX21_02095 [Acidimicrobiia bacterium]|nr:hypothetical protein [Acidimicrobiia bacterium]